MHYRFHRLYSSLTLLCLVAGQAVALPPRTSALSQRLDVQRLGFAVRYPASWSASENAGVVSIVNAPQARAAGRALETMPQILVTTEPRRDHADAVKRLREIASEYPGPVSYTTISGWPAMQCRVVTTKEQAGAEEKDDRPDQKNCEGYYCRRGGEHLNSCRWAHATECRGAD